MSGAGRQNGQTTTKYLLVLRAPSGVFNLVLTTTLTLRVTSYVLPYSLHAESHNPGCQHVLLSGSECARMRCSTRADFERPFSN